MQLYLLRHGIAGQHGDPHYPNDDERPLTKKGRKKITDEVAGLQDLGVNPDLILSSPLTRAKETAEIVAEGLGRRDCLVIYDGLAAQTPTEDLLAAIESYLTVAQREQLETLQVMLVGHEPNLSQAAAELSGGLGEIWLRKGGLIRVDLDALQSPRGTLRWLLEPEHLQVKK